MVEKNTYRYGVVDIFKEAPSEDVPEDSLDDLVKWYIKQAKKIAGEAGFDKRVEQFRSSFLSRRDEKKSVGNAQPLDQRSFLIAAAISIIRENDLRTANASKTTPPR